MNYYQRYIRTIKNNGTVRIPRGLPIISYPNVTFVTNVGLTYRRVGDNPLIGFMEGLQSLAGVFEHDQIVRIAPHAKLDLFTAQSAYGPRITNQLPEVIYELTKDTHSRRAVVLFGDPNEPLESRPCTTSMQFRIEKYMMNTYVTMRSSDAVWGLPYDLIQFSIIAAAVGQCVRYPANKLIINIGDAHIYADTDKQAMAHWIPWTFDLPIIHEQDFAARKEWSNYQIPLLSANNLADWSFKIAESKEWTN